MIYFAHRILGTQHYLNTRFKYIDGLDVESEIKKQMKVDAIASSTTFKALQRCGAIVAGGTYLLQLMIYNLLYALSPSHEEGQQLYNIINVNLEMHGWIAAAAFSLYLTGGIKGFLSFTKGVK